MTSPPHMTPEEIKAHFANLDKTIDMHELYSLYRHFNVLLESDAPEIHRLNEMRLASENIAQASEGFADNYFNEGD